MTHYAFRRPLSLPPAMTLLLVIAAALDCGDSGSGGSGGSGGTPPCVPLGESGPGPCCTGLFYNGHCATYGEGSGTASSVAASSSTGTAPCPDQTGAYDVVAMGSACGDINPTADQCVKTNLTACIDTFSSPDAGSGQALNGSVTIDMQGDFAASSITIGTSAADCSGTWDSGTDSMTATCGPMADCAITLMRSSSNCAP